MRAGAIASIMVAASLEPISVAVSIVGCFVHALTVLKASYFLDLKLIEITASL